MAKEGAGGGPDWNGLLKWSLAHGGDGTTPSRALSEEDRKWFMEAMQANTIDVVGRMKEIAQVMKTPDDVLQSHGVTTENIEDMLDELQEHVESIDMANDVCRVRVAGRIRPKNADELAQGADFDNIVELQPEVRRRAVVPSLHKRYLSVMVDKVFCKCAERLVEKLETYALSGEPVNMEARFSQMTLDVIGLSLFNYNFDSLTSDSPVIDAVYTALKEAEARSTDLLPYWQIDLLCKIVPRQIKAQNAVNIIRNTVEELITKCRAIVDAENEQIEGDEYVNEADPSILRFLLASREEVSSLQLRDDLLSMLVAGHETTGSVLTWTIYLLSKDPAALRKAQDEVDRVLQGRLPRYEDVKELKYLMRCINESMRLYPHPPVLIRRALVDDVLPGGYKVKPGQDIMISVYNIHRSPEVWDRADEFVPERFGLEGPIPNESNTDFRFIPFSGGPRKCVGDQFALLEAIVALAIVVQKMDVQLVADQKINMTTGATIHTTNGLYMNVSLRKVQQESDLALSQSR